MVLNSPGYYAWVLKISFQGIRYFFFGCNKALFHQYMNASTLNFHLSSEALEALLNKDFNLQAKS